ncbi:transmembrane protein 267-like [Daphnia carinata]|uniref:transmembrane protein 267-like n=1 Tax=Daphnia carinata TaxID=120202 RepID=UPI00257A887E|nr:transmembrane protein 267-like [Daphnia carinata]
MTESKRMWELWSLDYLKTKLDVKSTINLFLIPVIALTGDTAIGYIYHYESLILNCFVDSATHFMIASFSWNYVGNLSINKRSHMFAVFMCGLLASLIDIDHFIAVGTMDLQVATRLLHRPLLHCTTVLSAVAVLLALLSIKIHSIPYLKLSLIITTAVWTHHWRDGYRRGIWICPIGSTPPYGYVLYLVGLIALPLGLHFILRFTSELVQKAKNQDLQQVYLI